MDALGISSMDDIHWTPYTTLVYPALCTTVGLLAGLLGLGGGVVMVRVSTKATEGLHASACVSRLINGLPHNDFSGNLKRLHSR